MDRTLLGKAEILIVGAGFYGATLAERIATQLGRRVLVIDRRRHIGGNAYTEQDPVTGVEIHRYGPHLFHTSNEEVWNYLRAFTGFTAYRHRAFSTYRDKVYPLPINLATISHFFGRRLSPDEARDMIAEQATELGDRPPANLEEKAISLVGRPLYEALIKGYTAKQWQTDPRELPAQIIARLPVRYTFEDGYFNDRFQGQPVDGYTAIFEKMLAQELIETRLGIDFFDIKSLLPKDLPVVYTGPIDRYFDYSEGELGWRTIDIDLEVMDTPDHQGTAIMNYADEAVPYTRVVEFRHFNPERQHGSAKTLIGREYSRFAGRADEPYYPIDTRKDQAVYRRYLDRAGAEKNLHLGGRLGTYRYLDMHQAIGAALKVFETVLEPYFAGRLDSVSRST
ncbi:MULTISPECIES: UDP-galactopyranose mutase [unclassified Mesorhizobium]|uniref:UDP-galactopyranose mutase n=1 Tax=unclassified Mesorhizobium TaxID=325217 RepID=UPI0015E32C40|nr:MULTISPECIES: UDP-galactopyranose mutase [unclassified Mesorhizobium]MBZ9904601.1 UDP-galactopyranose mutase [Mesorhizobium sp. BR115XR7A]MBZ9932988.1 UDP-galactopyranose mutase [Mesorhizobium sp. BR1-1-5]